MEDNRFLPHVFDVGRDDGRYDGSDRNARSTYLCDRGKSCESSGSTGRTGLLVRLGLRLYLDNIQCWRDGSSVGVRTSRIIVAHDG